MSKLQYGLSVGRCVQNRVRLKTGRPEGSEAAPAAAANGGGTPLTEMPTRWVRPRLLDKCLVVPALNDPASGPRAKSCRGVLHQEGPGSSEQ